MINRITLNLKMTTDIGGRTAQLVLQSTSAFNFSRWTRHWGTGAGGASRQREEDFEMNIHVSRDVITDVSQLQLATADDRDFHRI